MMMISEQRRRDDVLLQTLRAPLDDMKRAVFSAVRLALRTRATPRRLTMHCCARMSPGAYACRRSARAPLARALSPINQRSARRVK